MLAKKGMGNTLLNNCAEKRAKFLTTLSFMTATCYINDLATAPSKGQTWPLINGKIINTSSFTKRLWKHLAPGSVISIKRHKASNKICSIVMLPVSWPMFHCIAHGWRCHWITATFNKPETLVLRIFNKKIKPCIHPTQISRLPIYGTR